MFLKSLTLKGFKSFAEHTSLDFELGVTIVVGPNGSGKSNLVDAVAWVLAGQGARSLRGTKMDDVIFAGSGNKPALGRAEVSLTIDNSSGLLPIGFSEVTITRTLFRESGESEYAINGAPCRLLDIQELLSDSGVGRTQHVIVSQGQLDSVLQARPEDRRTVIEEAAGVLKYRRHKEKAERRLVATESNLLRLQDLLREVRRQLRPLERQADAARRPGELAEVDSSARELVPEADGLTSAEAELARERDDFEARLTAGVPGPSGQAAEVRGELSALRASVDLGQAEMARLVARLDALQQRGDRLTTASERIEHELREAEAAERGLMAAVDEAEARKASAQAAATAAEAARRQAETEQRALLARVDALTLALEAASPAATRHALGVLSGLVEIDAGWETAVAAALGDALSALVVADPDAGRSALAALAAAGGVGTVTAGIVPPVAVSMSVPGAEPVRHHVRSHDLAVARVLDALLAGHV